MRNKRYVGIYSISHTVQLYLRVYYSYIKIVIRVEDLTILPQIPIIEKVSMKSISRLRILSKYLNKQAMDYTKFKKKEKSMNFLFF